MPKLVIDNLGMGGIAPSDRMGKANSFYVGEQADIITHLGYLTSGIKEANLMKSNDTPQILAGYINSHTIDAKNDYVYLIEQGTEIHQIKVSTLAITDNDPTTYPHTIGDDLTGHSGHGSFTGQDVIIYPIGTTHYLFYSWRDDNDGDVGQVELTGTLSFEDDWLSNTCASGAVLTKGVPHPMMEWQENGMLYVANGRNLVEIDGQTGANGTADMTAFQLPVGWVITSLFNANEFIGITAVYMPGVWDWTSGKTRAAVFFWDGSSSKWSKKVKVPDAEIRASYNLNGEYYIFGLDYFRGEGTIRKWDGEKFALVQRIIDNASATASTPPQCFGGVDEFKGGLVFPSKFNKIYFYGAADPDWPIALTNPWKTVVEDAQIQAVAVLLNNILVSYYDSDNAVYYLVKYTATTSGSDLDFVFKTLYYEFPQKIKINYVKFFFQTLTSSHDDDVKVEANYGATTYALGSIAHANDGAVQSKRFDYPIICDNFRIIIDTDEANATGAIRYSKIVVDWEYYEPDN